MFLKRKMLFNRLKDPQMSEQFMKRFTKFLIISGIRLTFSQAYC